MTLKELLGESYVEGMTVEEMEAALADKNFVDPNTLPKSVKKDVFDKVASELTKYKKELQELKTSQLTDEEMLKQKLEEAEKAKQELAIERNRMKAQEVFLKAGLDSEETEKLLAMAVSIDAEDTLAKAQSLVEVISAKQEVAQKKTKEELLKGTGKPENGGNKNPTMTKEDFKKLSYADRVKLRDTQPELYKKLTE